MEMLILCVVLVAAIAALAYNRASLTMFTAIPDEAAAETVPQNYAGNVQYRKRSD
jgi:NADH:ubiquinone oxidoreductase subunit 2 (subunit N)